MCLYVYMIESVSILVDRLRALGEINRLRILLLLRQGELSVGELAQIMGQSQPRLSHHLKSLTTAGLVERLPEGSWVFYSLPIGGDVRELIDRILPLIGEEGGAFELDLEQLQRVRETRARTAEDYFGEIADTWDTVRALHYPNEKIEAALIDLVDVGPSRRMIDIGTGTGRMLELFAERFEWSDGVDMSHRMLTVARANLERAGVGNVNVRQADAQALPFEDGCADLVTIHQVLHFIDEPERVLAEAARVLRPGGHLLIVDFAPHELEFLRTEHGHRRLGIRHERVAEWLGRAGLSAPDPHLLGQPNDADQGLSIQIWSVRAPLAAADILEGNAA
jgi:ArsR family transcriptional regulator